MRATFRAGSAISKTHAATSAAGSSSSVTATSFRATGLRAREPARTVEPRFQGDGARPSTDRSRRPRSCQGPRGCGWCEERATCDVRGTWHVARRTWLLFPARDLIDGGLERFVRLRAFDDLGDGDLVAGGPRD